MRGHVQVRASLCLLSLLAARSAGTGETVETAHQTIYLEFANLSVAPTDTTMTIAYMQPGHTALAVTLGNQTITATYCHGHARPPAATCARGASRL